MAKRPPSMCFECEKFIRAEDAGGDDDRVCTCEQAERRTIVVTMKERVAHIPCDDKGRAVVAACENEKEEEESSSGDEDEEEGSWEEEEESSSFEEMVGDREKDQDREFTPSDARRVRNSLWIDEAGLIRFVQAEWLKIVRRMSEEAKANGTQLTAAMIKEARAKWEDDMLKEAVERYHWEDPGETHKEDPSSSFDPNARCYIRRTYTVTDPETGKQTFVRCHFHGKELLESSVVNSLIDNYHARGCKCCECNVEEEDADGTPPPPLFCCKHQAEFQGERCEMCAEEEDDDADGTPPPPLEEDDDSSSSSLDLRLCEAHGGDFDAIVCEKCAQDVFDSVLHGNGEHEQLPTCDKHGSYNRALAECPGCVIVASESRVRIPIDPMSGFIDTKTGKRVVPLACGSVEEEENTSGDISGSNDDDEDVRHAMEHFMADFPETGPPPPKVLECARCAEAERRVEERLAERLKKEKEENGDDDSYETRQAFRLEQRKRMEERKDQPPMRWCTRHHKQVVDGYNGCIDCIYDEHVLSCDTLQQRAGVCTVFQKALDAESEMNRRNNEGEEAKKGFWRCRRHLDHAPGEKDLCMSCRREAFLGYPLRQYEKDYILPSGNEFVTPEQLEEELCARIGGRMVRPEPRVPCAVCDEAAFEMYTQNPDTGVRTCMKEAHEPKEHECPRRKKGLVRRGRGEFEHGFVPTSVRSKWIEEELERQKDKSATFPSLREATTRKMEPDRVTEPGEYCVMKETGPIDVSAPVRDIQIYDEMEEKQSPADNDLQGGPPVKWAKRVAFTIEHDIERPVRNAQGEIVYTWCETEHMEEDKPFITWYRLSDLPADVLQTMREDLQSQNTIEIVTVPGDPSVDWVKCSMWPPAPMAISGRYDDYAPVKLDDDDEDDSSSSSSSSDHDERDKLNAARASMKQYAEEQLALYSKVAQEMEKYFDEVRRGVGGENAMTRELNPLQLARMHDELKSFLKQKEEEEEDHGIEWSRGTLSPESLKKFARQQIVTKKLLDEYAKKYPHGVSFPETTEPGKLDDDVVSPPPKSTDDEMDRIRAVAKEMKNRKRDAAFNALRVKELEKYKAESEEEKKNSEPVSIVCADDTIVRTELITFPGDSGRDAILVIPRSVGKTGVMNWKRVFRGHGDPPPIPEKQKMAEEDAKPEPDSNNKRERDEEEEADERVKHASRYNGVYRGKIGPWKPIDLMCDKDIITARMQSLKDDDDEGPSELEEEEQEGVRVMSQARLIHHEQFMPSGRSLSVTYDRRDVPAEFVKDDDGVEETKRLQREHDMQQTLDALKGKGLEKFLEHNMPVYKEPATLAGILQHMMFERPDTFGVTENTLTVVRAIFDENSFDDAVHRCLMHLMANVDSLIHSSEILGQLRMMIYEHNDNKRQCKTSDTDINSIIGHAIAREDAHRRLTHAIRFVLTQAYLKGKRPN